MINIAIVHGVPDFSSGASLSLVSLVKGIKERSRYNPIVILPEPNCTLAKYFTQNEIEWHSFDYYDHWYVKLSSSKTHEWVEQGKGIVRYIQKYRKIEHFLLEKKIKLVHVNMLTCGSIGAIAQKLNIPVVWHLREFMEEDLDLRLINYRHKISIVNNASRIIAISEAVKKKYEPLLKAKISVVHNGIDNSDYCLRQGQILTEGKLSIVIVGRIFAKKGQLDAIKALEQLFKERHLPYQLNIVGYTYDKDYLKQIKEYIINQGAQDRVKFWGQIDNVSDILSQMDILLMASVKEAFGRVTIEGMFAGCLVVGADSGATSELLKETEDPYLYETGNISALAQTIYAVWQNKDQARKFALRSQKLAKEQFSVVSYVDGVIDIYDEVLRS